MAQKVFDARPSTRRSGIRRSELYAGLLLVRRSHGRPRLPHDSVSGSQRETPGCAEQNDLIHGRARLQPKQDALGRSVRARSSAHRGYVDVGSRAGARLHQAGDIENSNGLSRHYRPTAFNITQKRRSTQYIQKNKYKQIWNKTK